jgi:copper(I)-binding protein
VNKLWTVAILAVLLPGPASGAEPQQLVLADAWVRALPPGQPNTAAYLTITNPGPTAVTIIGATASLAETVEFHTIVQVDGLQRMQQLQQLSVPAGQSLQLAPGGTHLMLFSLGHMPEQGESVQLCLQPESGEVLCTEAVTRKSATAMQGHDHHQHNN